MQSREWKKHPGKAVLFSGISWRVKTILTLVISQEFFPTVGSECLFNGKFPSIY